MQIEVPVGTLPLSIYKQLMVYIWHNNIPYSVVIPSFLGQDWPDTISVAEEDATALRLRFGL
jgi:hypothetical protein